MNFSALRLLTPLLLLVQFCTSENRYCQEAVESVTTVGSCPTTKAGWDAAAHRKNCSRIASTQKCSDVDKFVYHCVINGYRNQTLEVCAPLRIIFGHCVEFNVGGGVIQDQRSAKCNDTFPKCESIYNSVDAYKYPDCYKLVSLSDTLYSTTTSSTNTVATAAAASTKETTTYESDSAKNIAIIAAVVSVTTIILIVAIILVLWKRRCKKRRQRVPNGEVPNGEVPNGVVLGGEAQEEINCTEEVGMLQRGCDALTIANNVKDTEEEQNKCQKSATDTQTKDPPDCKRTRTYSS
ncbi:uncharacterized protein LOC128184751 isoform X1 [Crassostrea angulata]|uniref:uncharacterized protein LOC128184751 isoform X1 n=1 Tax=Magallana angulata TaxID=2784310 RepID=UPI0022B1B218|nr:uncharacterized protein LOC128184751 isoform X1 [Crassostrea angulata]